MKSVSIVKEFKVLTCPMTALCENYTKNIYFYAVSILIVSAYQSLPLYLGIMLNVGIPFQNNFIKNTQHETQT